MTTRPQMRSAWAFAMLLVALLAVSYTAAEAQGPGRAFQQGYRGMVHLMQQHARAAGLPVDEDIYVLTTSTYALMYTTIDGFEDLRFPDEYATGADVGFLYVGGLPGVPDGFYALRTFIDPEAFARGDARPGWSVLVGRGGTFPLVLEVAADPNPERGPRKTLTVEDPAPVEGFEGGWTIYNMSNGITTCHRFQQAQR